MQRLARLGSFSTARFTIRLACERCDSTTRIHQCEMSIRVFGSRWHDNGTHLDLSSTLQDEHRKQAWWYMAPETSTVTPFNGCEQPWHLITCVSHRESHAHTRISKPSQPRCPRTLSKHGNVRVLVGYSPQWPREPVAVVDAAPATPVVAAILQQTSPRTTTNPKKIHQLSSREPLLSAMHEMPPRRMPMARYSKPSYLWRTIAKTIAVVFVVLLS